LKGGEVWETTQDVGNLTTDFKIRYFAGITPAMRIVFEGENYDIKRVIEVTRRKGYVIQAQWKDNR
jgi:SPP1 family predicted phage head-tail adaptor